jgi:hypothetical protein
MASVATRASHLLRMWMSVSVKASLQAGFIQWRFVSGVSQVSQGGHEEGADSHAAAAAVSLMAELHAKEQVEAIRKVQEQDAAMVRALEKKLAAAAEDAEAVRLALAAARDKVPAVARADTSDFCEQTLEEYAVSPEMLAKVEKEALARLHDEFQKDYQKQVRYSQSAFPPPQVFVLPPPQTDPSPPPQLPPPQLPPPQWFLFQQDGGEGRQGSGRGRR